MEQGFWTISIGNILTAGSLLLSFWLAHRGNVKRIEDGAANMAEMKAKVDLIYSWFQNNVIGRGESERSHGD